MTYIMKRLLKVNSSNREISYIKPKIKYSKDSIIEECMIKFSKRISQSKRK